VFPDAQSYLQAVAEGRTPPDALRIQAAKALLAYELPKVRPKAHDLTPKAMRQKEKRARDQGILQDFETKAREIRAKYTNRGTK